MYIKRAGEVRETEEDDLDHNFFIVLKAHWCRGAIPLCRLANHGSKRLKDMCALLFIILAIN